MLKFKEFIAEKRKQSEKKTEKKFSPIRSMDFSSDDLDDDEQLILVSDPLDNRVVG